MARIAQNDVNRVFENASRRLQEAGGGDGRVSRADAQRSFEGLTGAEKKVVDLFFKTADARDAAPGHQVTASDLRATVEHAKLKLVAKYDLNTNGLSADEIAQMSSQLGRAAVALVKELKAARVGEGTPVSAAPSAAALALKTELTAAVEGLFTPSETNAGFAVLVGPQLDGAPIDAALIRSALGRAHDERFNDVMAVSEPENLPLSTRTRVESGDGLEWLQRQVDNADPQDELSTANGQKFAALKALVEKNLSDVKVFRFGEIEIHTFVAGRTKSGELLALLTGQVET